MKTRIFLQLYSIYVCRYIQHKDAFGPLKTSLTDDDRATPAAWLSIHTVFLRTITGFLDETAKLGCAESNTRLRIKCYLDISWENSYCLGAVIIHCTYIYIYIYVYVLFPQ